MQRCILDDRNSLAEAANYYPFGVYDKYDGQDGRVIQGTSEFSDFYDVFLDALLDINVNTLLTDPATVDNNLGTITVDTATNATHLTFSAPNASVQNNAKILFRDDSGTCTLPPELIEADQFYIREEIVANTTVTISANPSGSAITFTGDGGNDCTAYHAEVVTNDATWTLELREKLMLRNMRMLYGAGNPANGNWDSMNSGDFADLVYPHPTARNLIKAADEPKDYVALADFFTKYQDPRDANFCGMNWVTALLGGTFGPDQSIATTPDDPDISENFLQTVMDVECATPGHRIMFARHYPIRRIYDLKDDTDVHDINPSEPMGTISCDTATDVITIDDSLQSDGSFRLDPPDNQTTVTFDPVTDTIVATDFPAKYRDRERIHFTNSGGSFSGTGIDEYQHYYMIEVSKSDVADDTAKIMPYEFRDEASLTDILGAGTGTFSVWESDQLNQEVQFLGGDLCAPLVADTPYYVQSIIGTDQITVSETQYASTPLDLTDTGSGTQEVFKNFRKFRLRFFEWTEYMEELVAARDYIDEWWCITQAIGESGVYDWDHFRRIPTYAELNAMLHSCVMHGARGIVTFAANTFEEGQTTNGLFAPPASYPVTSLSPTTSLDGSLMTDAMRDVGALVRDHVYFANNHVPWDVSFTVSNPDLRVAFRQAGQRRFIYVINMETTTGVAETGTITFDNPTGLTTVRDLLNNDTKSIGGSSPNNTLAISLTDGEAEIWEFE
jgi:hypothetical protein